MVVHTGLSKVKIPVEQIKYFRKFEHPDYNTLAIRYFNKNGKLKLLETLASKSSLSFEHLLLRMKELCPIQDLSSLSQKEALREMKTVSLASLVALTFAIVSLIIVPISFYVFFLLNLKIPPFAYIVLGLIPLVSFFLYFFKYRGK